MSAGFYLMHRGWLDHPAFGSRKREPFCRAAAWAWLIEHAAYGAIRVRIGGAIATLQRGQLSHSLRHLGEAWGWQHDRVRRFLGELEKRAMIATDRATGQTVITICNYNDYQAISERRATTPNGDARQQCDSSATRYKERKEGEAKRNLSESEKTESVAARASATARPPEPPPQPEATAEDFKIVDDGPEEQRCALPPQAPSPETPEPEPPPDSTREIKKKQLGQKLFRFINATMTGAEQMAATLGLMGLDPEHTEQQWFDEIDRRRRRAGWDDMRNVPPQAWGPRPVGAMAMAV
jgi:hypothetical protein